MQHENATHKSFAVDGKEEWVTVTSCLTCVSRGNGIAALGSPAPVDKLTESVRKEDKLKTDGNIQKA